MSPFIVSHAHKGRVQYCCSCSNVYVFSRSQVVSAVRGLLYGAEVWFHVKMCRAQTSGEYTWFGCKTFHVWCMYTVVGGYSRGASECSSCYVAMDVVIVRRHGFFLFSGATSTTTSYTGQWLICVHVWGWLSWLCLSESVGTGVASLEHCSLCFVIHTFCSNIHSHNSIMCYLVMGLHINHSWAQTADRVVLSKL